MAASSTQLAHRPAVKGARRLMLQSLEEAEAAADRLRHPDDTEALHDLRVALRHLRTYLATYRKLFRETVSDRSVDGLRRLTRATSAARDAEVQAAWLSGQSETRRAPAGAAARLRSQLTERHGQLLRELHERFLRDFPPLARRLRRELERARGQGGRTLGRYTAKQVRRGSRRLHWRLARLEGVADVEGCHEARIAAKRVRYLLEPFTGELRGAGKLVERLKALQDTLGQLHDLHVLLETLTELPESPRARKGREASELTRLAANARQRLRRLYTQVEQGWLGDAELDRALAKVARALREAP